MIYVTGDCHADFRKFGSKRFKAQKEMTREGFVIVCGDFGGVWKDDERERYRLNWLAQKPFTLLLWTGTMRILTAFTAMSFRRWTSTAAGRTESVRISIT